MDAFSWLGRVVVDRRGLIVVLLAVVTVTLALFVPGLRFDFRPEAMLEFSPEEEAFAADFESRFGGQEATFLVVLHTPQGTMLSRQGLNVLAQLSSRLEALEGVAGVYALPRVPRRELSALLGAEGGGRWLMEGLEASEADLARVKERVAGSKLLQGGLISADGKTALIMVNLAPDFVHPNAFEPLLRRLEAEVPGWVREVGGEDVEFFFGGLPYARTMTIRYMKSEQLTLWPLVGVIYFFALLLIFRRFFQALLPLVSVGAVVLWSIGLMVLMDQPATMINNTLPLLILVIGVCNGIHVMMRILEERGQGHAVGVAISRGVARVGLASLLTTSTTAIGFASLVVAHSRVLRDFGLVIAMAVMLTYVAIIVVLPVLCTFVPLTPRIRGMHAGGAVDRMLSRVARWVYGHAGWVMAGSLATLMLGVLLGSTVPFDSRVMDAFEASHPVVQANGRIERDLGGILPLAIDLQGRPGLFAQAETLRQVALLEQEIAAVDGVLSTLSLTDLLRESGLVDPPGQMAPLAVAGALRAIAKVQPEALSAFVSSDFSNMAITVRLPDAGIQRALEAIAAIDVLCARTFGPEGVDARYRMTGVAYLSAVGLDTFVRDLFYGLLMATLIIFLVLVVVFRSLWVGLASLLPNLLPLAVTLGAMPLYGYELNTTTVLVFTISIGLAVDNSIHMIARFRQEFARLGRVEEAVEATVRGAGRAIILSNLLLIFGLAVLLVSSFEPIRRVGVLTMTTIGAALVSALLLVPAELRWLGKRLARAPGAGAEGL